MDQERFLKLKDKAHNLYIKKRSIYNPYLQTEVVLNSDGFHHLEYSARRERSKLEQALKFRLLPLALETIKKSNTLQEFRETWAPIGKKSTHGTPMKKVTYWGVVAILGENKVKVRTILRRIGDGNITFWSVMPDRKLGNGQKLFDANIEDF